MGIHAGGASARTAGAAASMAGVDYWPPAEPLSSTLPNLFQAQNQQEPMPSRLTCLLLLLG
jgi:hypothetical protein